MKEVWFMSKGLKALMLNGRKELSTTIIVFKTNRNASSGSNICLFHFCFHSRIWILLQKKIQIANSFL